MKFGYARVSTHVQTHALLQFALKGAGCEQLFTEPCSGAVAYADRPELQRLREQMRKNDVLGFVNALDTRRASRLSLTRIFP